MTRTEHLLSITAEECAEVAQRVTKAMRFGLTEIQPGQPFTNADRIMAEFNDLQAMIEMHRHRFSTERGPNLPDCDWLECCECDFKTDPE
jgi:NTP pyrophosphatase (non-canonical NTP hydrolase)